MAGLEHVLREHPFFANISSEYSELVASCARNHVFKAGEYLFHQGDYASEFYLIREGRVALEVVAPGHPAIVFSTLGKGEIVGASWLVAPYRWVFAARALEYTRAFGINAECLRGKCEADHDLGYEMMKRFLPVLLQRLQATRLQIMDVYGKR